MRSAKRRLVYKLRCEKIHGTQSVKRSAGVSVDLGPHSANDFKGPESTLISGL